jgi:hypothetical protein
MLIVAAGSMNLINNRPFQGATDQAKVYAGLGSSDLIRYRPNQVFDGNNIPINYQALNDVSVATETNPDDLFMFVAPVEWYSRDDIWLQVRTSANDYENETLYRPRRIALDGSGNLVRTISGTYVLLGVDPGDAGSPSIRFMWTSDRSSLAVLEFQAVYVSGTSNFGTVTVPIVRGRVQRLELSGLATGSYSCTLKAKNSSVLLTLGTVTFTVASAPTTTGALVIVEN